jgi:hypothetical protein
MQVDNLRYQRKEADMLRRNLLLLPLLTLLVCGPGRGQATVTPAGAAPVPPPSAEEQPPKLDPETEKKALDLVETLAEQVLNLHTAANRVRAEIQVADLLWVRDEKRARTLFSAAVNQLINQISDLDYSDPEVYNEMTRISGLRGDLILRLAVHDADMAIDVLNRTHFQGDNRSRYGANWTANNESYLEMSLANAIVANNSEAALKLARASLSRGVSGDIISFLPKLYQKDTKAAQSLYQDVVSRIKDDNVSRNGALANNAWGLLNSFQPPQADEDTFRDLLTTMLGYLLSMSRQTQQDINAAQGLNRQIERIMPLIEKYAPARAVELRDWSRGVDKTVDPNARMYQEMMRLTEKGTVDELLALASKYPPEFQSLIYQNAAWKATGSGDTARGKEIADKISDPVQRRQVIDQLDNLAARNAQGDNKIVEARRLAEKTTNINRKIDILLQSAMSLVATDKKAALDLLSEAKSVLAATPQSAAELTAEFSIMRIYLRVDPQQVFAMLQPMVGRLNELVSAAVVLDGIDYRYLKDGEWIMQNGNGLSSMVMSLDRMLADLGRVDFERARALADQIGRPEMRVMMEIDLVQTTIKGRPSPNLMSFPGRITAGNVIIN